MKTVVVIQARTNSSRLPGKVLLPIGGHPIVILAAKRAANTGLDVIVTTSNECTDDALVSLLNKYEVRNFRGSLNNTLDRVVSSLNSYSDDTNVVRLTADNVGPDGHLITEVLNDFISSQVSYMYCNGECSGLPYGMSLEITKLSKLREANKLAKSSFEKEHVTPFIIKKYGKNVFKKYKNQLYGRLNSTIDNLDDYLFMEDVFKTIKNPVTVPFLTICDLIKKKQQVTGVLAPKKFVLGTAQLGLNYGITNELSQPTQVQSFLILKTALQNKITSIDTASAYGESEEIIGRFLSTGWQGRADVITKLFINDDELSRSEAEIELIVKIKILKSLLNLKVDFIDVLLLHRVDYAKCLNGAVWATLVSLKKEGIIKQLGVSVQNPDEAKFGLQLKGVDHIQMPYNILDWRWNDIIDQIKQVKARKQLTIHCRSAFLQGLFLSREIKLWNKAGVEDPSPVFEYFDMLQIRTKMPLTDILLTYITQQEWVDGVVVGIACHEQLISNLNSPAFEGLNIDFDNLLKKRPVLTKQALDPSLWKV